MVRERSSSNGTPHNTHGTFVMSMSASYRSGFWHRNSRLQVIKVADHDARGKPLKPLKCLGDGKENRSIDLGGITSPCFYADLLKSGLSKVKASLREACSVRCVLRCRCIEIIPILWNEKSRRLRIAFSLLSE